MTSLLRPGERGTKIHKTKLIILRKDTAEISYVEQVLVKQKKTIK